MEDTARQTKSLYRIFSRSRKYEQYKKTLYTQKAKRKPAYKGSLSLRTISCSTGHFRNFRMLEEVILLN